MQGLYFAYLSTALQVGFIHSTTVRKGILNGDYGYACVGRRLSVDVILFKFSCTCSSITGLLA